MSFTPKQWKDAPSTETPLNAEGIIDLETRTTGYADETKVAKTEKGVASGVATLNSEGHLPENQQSPSVVIDSANIDMNLQYGCKSGEDVTAKINKAIEEAVTAGFSVVKIRFSKAGTYLINGAVKEGEAFGYKYAGQILLPARTLEEGPLVIEIEGLSIAPRTYYAGSKEPTALRPGVVLKSNATSGSVIDVIPAFDLIGGSYPFSNLFVKISNLVVECPNNPKCNGIKLQAAGRAQVEGVGLEIEDTIEGEETFPTEETTGLWLPRINHDGYVVARDVYIAGFGIGLKHSESSTLRDVMIIKCAVGIEPFGNQGHAVHYDRVETAKCSIYIRCKNEGEYGGTIHGYLDIQDEEEGPFKTKAVIEDEGNRLFGDLSIFPQNHPGRGFTVKGAKNLNFSNMRNGSIGWLNSYPIDDFKRAIDVAGQPGCCNQTSHPWHVSEGNITTIFGAPSKVTASGASAAQMVVSYMSNVGTGSRLITATLEPVGASYNFGLIVGAVIAGGANAGNSLLVHLQGGRVKITKRIGETTTTLAQSSEGIVSAGNAYEVTVQVTCPSIIGAPTNIAVFVGNVEVVSYELTAEDRASLSQVVGQLMLQDGLRWAENNEATSSYFRVIPYLPGQRGSAGATGFTPSTLLLPSSVKTYTGTGSNASENKAVKGESIARSLATGTLLLVSGTPVIAALPLPASTVISGLIFDVTTIEGTPANRTHLWVALLNLIGEELAIGLDYTSSVNTPMEAKLLGLRFAEPFETANVPTLYQAVLCEVMSSTNPITIAAKEGGIISPAPILGGTGNAGQTVPGSLPKPVTTTAGSKIPWIAAF